MHTLALFLSLLIIGIAAGRVAYSITHDEIFRRLREWIWLRSAPHSGMIVEYSEDGDDTQLARSYHWSEVPQKVRDDEANNGIHFLPDGYRYQPQLPIRKPQFWGQLVECPMCMSFWIAIIFWVLWQFAPFEIYYYGIMPLAVWGVANWFAVKAL